MKPENLVRLTRLILVRGFGVFLALAIAILIPAKFGVTAETDAFFLARMIIVGMTTIIFDSSPAILVPSFAAMAVASGAAHLKRTALTYSAVGAGIGLGLAGLIVLGSPGLMGAVSASEETRRLGAALLRIFSFCLPFALGAVACRAYFEARQKPAVPAATQSFNRLFLAFGLIMLTPPLTLTGLSYLFTAGWAAALGVLLVLMMRTGPQATAPQTPAEPASQQIRQRALAMLVLLISSQIGNLLKAYFAAQTFEGGLTVIELSQRLVNIVPTIIMASLYTIYLADWSHRAAKAPLRMNILGDALLLGAILLAPIAIFFGVNAHTIVDLIYNHGAFTDEDAATVSRLILLFTPTAFLTFASNIAYVHLFASARRPIILPLTIIVILENAIRLAALALGVTWMGLSGIPIGGAVTLLLTTLLVVFWRRDEFEDTPAAPFLKRTLLVLGALAASLLGGVFVAQGLTAYLSQNLFSQAVLLGLSGLAQMAIYAALLIKTGAIKPAQIARMLKRKSGNDTLKL